MTTTDARTLPLDAIRVGDNVRRQVGDVSELADSIRAVGLLQPLVVRLGADDVPELVAGHRRLEALRLLGETEAPIAWTHPSAGTAEEVAAAKVAAQLVENLQREDLTVTEEAAALADLVALLGSQKAAADAVGRSKAHVSKRLRIAGLAPDVAALVDAGTFTADDAYELAKLDTERQTSVAVGVAKRLADGVNPATARARIAEAVREVDRAADDRKAAKAAEASGEFGEGVRVVALPDVPADALTLEGFAGLAIPSDEHEGEPCHLVVVGHHRSWVDETTAEAWCADPARHEDDGESELKTMRTKDDAAAEERRAAAAAQRDEQRRRTEAFDAAAAAHAAAITDRYGVLRALSLHTLSEGVYSRGPTSELVEALTVAGVDLPEDTRANDWDDAPELTAAVEDALTGGATNAELYRAASYVALRAAGWTAALDDTELEPVDAAIFDALGADPDEFTKEAK